MPRLELFGFIKSGMSACDEETAKKQRARMKQNRKIVIGSFIALLCVIGIGTPLLLDARSSIIKWTVDSTVIEGPEEAMLVGYHPSEVPYLFYADKENATFTYGAIMVGYMTGELVDYLSMNRTRCLAYGIGLISRFILDPVNLGVCDNETWAFIKSRTILQLAMYDTKYISDAVLNQEYHRRWQADTFYVVAGAGITVTLDGYTDPETYPIPAFWGLEELANGTTPIKMQRETLKINFGESFTYNSSVRLPIGEFGFSAKISATVQHVGGLEYYNDLKNRTI